MGILLSIPKYTPMNITLVNTHLTLLRKAAFSLALGSLLLVGNSCEEKKSDPSPTATFNFKNQVAQGSIEGSTWMFKDGKASEESGGSSMGLSVELSSTDYANPCTEFALKTQIRFYVWEKVAVGVYDMDKDGFANFIGVGFVAGGLEVTSITATTVTGKVDVKYTDTSTGITSQINGNFTVPFCK